MRLDSIIILIVSILGILGIVAAFIKGLTNILNK